MKLLNWLRNVTTARHFFIFATFTIGLLCLYIYAFIFGAEKLNLSLTSFYGIISIFFAHLVWVFVSTIIHIVKDEWKPAIAKGILCIAYIVIIYGIYIFSSIVFFETSNSTF